jgi:hypothetical protein
LALARAAAAKKLGVGTVVKTFAISRWRTVISVQPNFVERARLVAALRADMKGKNVSVGRDLDELLKQASSSDFRIPAQPQALHFNTWSLHLRFILLGALRLRRALGNSFRC